MKRRPAADRQTEIAEAILRVAGSEGVAALTMERVGREVGVTSGALFRHFPSRAAMLDEAARRAVALLEATFPPAELPPIERLRQFVVARSELALEHGAIPHLVFSEQFGKALPPAGARAVRRMVRRTLGFVSAALREAASRGETRRDVPPEELALTVMGAIFARVLFGTLAEDADVEPRLGAEKTWNHILGVIRSPETEAAGPKSMEGVQP